MARKKLKAGFHLREIFSEFVSDGNLNVVSSVFALILSQQNLTEITLTRGYSGNVIRSDFFRIPLADS